MHVENDVEDDAGFHGCHAGDLLDPLDRDQGHLLDIHPEIGEAVLAVVIALGVTQDPLRRQEAGKGAHANGDDGDDRKENPRAAAEVSPELMIQCAHVSEDPFVVPPSGGPLLL